MQPDLNSLRIDKSLKSSSQHLSVTRRAKRWMTSGGLLLLLLGAAWFVYNRADAATEVEVMRVNSNNGEAANTANGAVFLSASGYIVAHHKIQVASKVVGKVAWIGVEKGDRVKEGQVIVRLEDDEYRTRQQQAIGQLASFEARLQELLRDRKKPGEIG